MLRRWDRFIRFIDEGRICLTNNAAERALRGFALGRKSWLFGARMRSGLTTVPLQSRPNASPFWIMLLLSSTARR